MHGCLYYAPTHLDSQIAHSTESDVVVLEKLCHRKEKVCRLRRGELFALIRQVDYFRARL